MSAEHIKSFDRLNSRKQQMLALVEFRPYWIKRGVCTEGKKEIHKAGEVACPCELADFTCDLNSLTNREFSQLKVSQS